MKACHSPCGEAEGPLSGAGSSLPPGVRSRFQVVRLGGKFLDLMCRCTSPMTTVLKRSSALAFLFSLTRITALCSFSILAFWTLGWGAGTTADQFLCRCWILLIHFSLGKNTFSTLTLRRLLEFLVEALQRCLMIFPLVLPNWWFFAWFSSLYPG